MRIRGYDYIEFYVGSAKMAANWYVHTLGMKIAAYMGPETGVKDRVSYLLVLNSLKFVVTAALSPSAWDINAFVTSHGDGVKRWSMLIENIDEAFKTVVSKGAIPIGVPREYTDEHGTVKEAAVKLYDDCEIVLVNRDNYDGVFKPGYVQFETKSEELTNETGLQAVDHIVGNTRKNEMQKWSEYFIEAFDFEKFIYFGPGDIATEYSTLLSMVVRSKDNLIKNPINEPFEGLMTSQIEEFIHGYNGSGIQHIALTTENIIETTKNLRKNGLEFLETPKTYYDDLRKKWHEISEKKRITENIDELEKYQILCDPTDPGYLLQIFTKPIGDRPTFFFEIIQRKEGANAFGQGNFQELFNSVELEQRKRSGLE